MENRFPLQILSSYVPRTVLEDDLLESKFLHSQHRKLKGAILFADISGIY